jgi:hypothetical protein
MKSTLLHFLHYHIHSYQYQKIYHSFHRNESFRFKEAKEFISMFWSATSEYLDPKRQSQTNRVCGLNRLINFSALFALLLIDVDLVWLWCLVLFCLCESLHFTTGNHASLFENIAHRLMPRKTSTSGPERKKSNVVICAFLTDNLKAQANALDLFLANTREYSTIIHIHCSSARPCYVSFAGRRFTFLRCWGN